MNIEQAIIKVIMESGPNGISSRRIALHVHGEMNSLFSPVALEAVTAEVRHYLQAQTKKKPAFIERVGGTHRFRFNMQAIADSDVPELAFLPFSSSESTDSVPQESTSGENELSLF